MLVIAVSGDVIWGPARMLDATKALIVKRKVADHISRLAGCIKVTSPPPIRRPNLADFADLVCRIVGFLNLADLFCRVTRFLGLCRLVLPTCWGLWVLGHLSWRQPLLWDTA